VGGFRTSWTVVIKTTQDQIENTEPLTTGINHCWQRVFIGILFWLPCATSTTNRSYHATVHTCGRWPALLKSRNMSKSKIAKIFVLIAFSWNTVLAQNEHLEPANGLFSLYDFQFEYYSQVRTVLFKGLDDSPEIRFLVMPSFSPENVLDIEYNREIEKYYIIYRICDKMIWYNDTWAKTKIVEYKKEIAKESVELIKDLFGTAILNAKFPEDDIMGVDGADYYFTINKYGLKTATIWSPDKGTKMAKLVKIGYDLIDLAKNDDKIIELSEELKKDIVNLMNDFN